ncbi:hypothetical protein COV23_01640 [Candidatus Wolfebacteria bacterium CG10_big_fil_rev_8_21_14_0_10_31_9]|uniref:Uncharacterized protein n=1 Tax=Candidatus Wolfebacteria bacterium CG10_big_fil_rev_8_21_14_0_10_31_9 TaxID=1975070 RepID=A0A2H0RC88_9BACT|nr:MAG: hypothetical protein COV23_01640 [Candidatus Wolfebacteria bacterium CG10_big_fil_rev_8_21_14_0_10_31_9]
MRHDEIKWLLVMLKIFKRTDVVTGRYIIGNKRFQDAVKSAVKIIEKSIELDEKDFKIIMDFSEEVENIAKKESWQNRIKLVSETLKMNWREIEKALTGVKTKKD